MSDPAPPANHGFLLWHATLRWQRMLAAALKPLDLTHAQFVLLAVLWWSAQQGERPTQRSLAERAGTDPMMTSQVLRTLERKGHLVRRPHPGDARARQLELTAGGTRLAERAIAVVEAADAEFFAPIEDRDGLRDALLTLARLDAGRVPPRVTPEPGAADGS